MKKTFLAAVAVTLMTTGGAFAATLTGLFDVTAYQITGANSVQSRANQSTLDATVANGVSFQYDGTLDFRAGSGNSSLTVDGWLALGSGTVIGSTGALGGLQLSKGNINKNSATTTFFLFSLNTAFSGMSFDINHDDGVAVVDGTTTLAGVQGPTGERNSQFGPLSGSDLGIFYAATNGNPSVLEVSAVPLPASAWLMLAGLGGIAAARSRKRAA